MSALKVAYCGFVILIFGSHIYIYIYIYLNIISVFSTNINAVVIFNIIFLL